MVSPSLARRSGWGVAAVLSLLLDLATCQVTSTHKFSSTPTNFQGFYIAPTTVEQINCATTRTWTTSGNFGACCVSGSVCTYYTHCQGGTVTRMDGSFWTCSADFPDCFTMTVLPSSPYLAATSSWLVMGCGKNWKANTVYREIVPTAAAVTRTLTADGTTITASPSSQPPTKPETSEPAAAGASPGQGTDTSSQQTGTPAPTPEPQQAEPSKAWIAGAVVGPLVAVGALGFLFFWLGKRKGEKDVGTPPPPPAGYASPDQQQQQQYYAGQHPGSSMYSGSPPPQMGYAPVPMKHEMYGGGYQGQQGYYPPQQVHELPPQEMRPQEMPAGTGR